LVAGICAAMKLLLRRTIRRSGQLYAISYQHSASSLL